MKITGSSDWRDRLAFDVPVVVADVVPGEPTRCSACGMDSPPRERAELWAVKRHNPKSHAGLVRFYCSAHVPPPPAARGAASAVSRAPAERRPRAAAAQRASGAPERAAAVCPTCFMEVPASGICGVCGEKVV